ncbi:MAG: DEAD/DEAH box helicase, partial [Candidatus Hydrothermarchaeota archaeon]
MRKALLFLKGRRSLGLWFYSKDKILFEGEVEFDPKTLELGRLRAKKLPDPAPPKEVLRLLRSAQVSISLDPRTRAVAEGLKASLAVKDVEAETLDLCPPCLYSGSIRPMGEAYLLHGQRVCRDCARRELERELAYRRMGGARKALLELLDKTRDLDKVLLQIERSYALDRGLTLYDRVEGGEEAGGASISVLPIAPEFKGLLLQRGLKGLLPVQALALEAGLLRGENLLVVSATASGKTLIGELAGVEAALKGKRLLYLVPLVALANQKHKDFQAYRQLGLRAAIRVGMSRIRGEDELVVVDRDHRRADILVGTYEGIDQILRRGEVGALGDVGVIVIDEVHILGEEERGIEVDGLITRLKYAFPGAQFLCLSATVGNVEEIAARYRLRAVVHGRRPVPLERHLVYARNEEEKLEVVRRLVAAEGKVLSPQGYKGQSIVFTNARRRAEELAMRLRRSGIKAMAYHGGLPYSRRRKVEEFFQRQAIACVVTTAALGAGVDFPASQVVFETLSMGRKWLTVREFQQMLGRSGRPLYHQRGKVVLIAQPGERYSYGGRAGEDEVALRLLNGSVEPIEVPAQEEELLAQLLADICVAGDEASRLMGSMLHPCPDLAEGVARLEAYGLVKGYSATALGRAAAAHFLVPRDAAFMCDHMAMEPTDLLSRLYPLRNAYIAPGLKARLEETYRTRIPGSYFDAVGAIFQEPREEFMDLLKLVRADLVTCGCKEAPYCDHGPRALTRKLLELRLEGLGLQAIARELRDYGMEIYFGDLFKWLDGIIRKLDGLEEICGIVGKEAKRKEIVEMKRGLE